MGFLVCDSCAWFPAALGRGRTFASLEAVVLMGNGDSRSTGHVAFSEWWIVAR